MGKNNEEVLRKLKGGLIVSCQALPGEPLHSAFIMGRMALAATQAGAVGIRANSVEDIMEIRKHTDLPIVGIIKKVYDDFPDVYITPTLAEVESLIECGVEIIAVDATTQVRPGGLSLEQFFETIRRKYPNQLFMADCSTTEEGIVAANLGFDLIGTTMAGYTTYTKGRPIPPYDMIQELVNTCGKPVVAEGNISTPEQLRKAIDLGIYTAVVGSAITRPQDIAKKFIEVL